MGIPIFTRLSEVCRGYALWSIRVMILRVWVWGSAEDDSRISMILTDEEGTRIHAVVSPEEYRTFRYVSWMEGSWFRLKDPHVESSSDVMVVAPHQYRLKFNSNTTFYQVINDIPTHHFMVFTTFNDIYNGNVDDSYPIDVLGVVTEVGNLEPAWGGPKLQFTLRNDRFEGLECLVYGNLATRLRQRFLAQYDNHLFVIMRCFYVVRYSGRVWLKSRHGPSDIKWDVNNILEFYHMVDNYPHPVPSQYSNDHRIGLIVF